MLGGVVGPAVAPAVTLRESAVEQDGTAPAPAPSVVIAPLLHGAALADALAAVAADWRPGQLVPLILLTR